MGHKLILSITLLAGLCACIFVGCVERDIATDTNQITVKDTVINSMPMVFVPAGQYCSGLDAKLENITYDYFIGKYEVTNAQFYRFLNKAIQDSIITWQDDKLICYYEGDSLVPAGNYNVKVFGDRISVNDGQLVLNQDYANHPVISVTWFGARAFCDYYGFTIPSPEEWEKAARGDKDYWYPWGNDIDASYANYFESGDPFEPGTTPIGFYDGSEHNGFKTSNAISVYGCYDMAGNAWEWTTDFWRTDIPYHTGKGGGFHYHTPAFLQVYYTSCYGPSTPPSLDMCDKADGFRVVKRM